MIVSWAICLLRGNVEAPTYLKDTGRVLVIIGSFYPDILVILGFDHTRLHLPGVWGIARSKHKFIWFLISSKSVCLMSLSRGLLDITFRGFKGL